MTSLAPSLTALRGIEPQESPPEPDSVRELDEALARASETNNQGLSRKNVPQDLLGKPKLSRLLRYAAEEWAMLLGCAAAITWGPAWLYPLWALVMGGRIHALGVLLHDAAHMPMRKKSAAAQLLEVMCGFPLGTSIEAMRYHHVRHHRDTNMGTDPYYKTSLASHVLLYPLYLVRFVALPYWWMLRAPFGVLTWAVPSLRNVYAFVFLQDRSGKDLRNSAEVARCARADLPVLLFDVALWVTMAQATEAVIFYYLIPLAIASLANGYRFLVEHSPQPVTNRKMATIIAITRDHNLNTLGRFLFAPRNIGCHIVHHLHPQVALENLPALRAWYLQNHPQVYPKL